MAPGVRPGLAGPGGYLSAGEVVRRWWVMLVGALQTMLEHWLGG